MSDEGALVPRPDAEPGTAPWRYPTGHSPQERLAALDAAAEVYLQTQRPPNTLRAYAADWKIWEDYTADLGIPLLANTGGALVGFVRWLETTKDAAPTSIDRHLTGVVVELGHLGVTVEPHAQRKARQALNGYRTRLAAAKIVRGRGKASPIGLPDLAAVSTTCPDTLAGLRDRAMVLVGFGMASRCSDLSQLDVTDIADVPEGIIVTVRVGKSIGESFIPRGRHPETCAVRAWTAWKQSAELTAGPAFRPIDRHGNLGRAKLSTQAVDAILVRAGERAALPYRLTAHCLRAGMPTEARRVGVHDDVIARQGRWQPGSKALQTYFRTVDRWTDNPLKDVDL